MSFEQAKIGDCTLYQGDCRAVLPTLGEVDSVVTDPPYGLSEPRSGGDGKGRGTGVAFTPRTEETKAKRRGGFMGQKWDSDVPDVETWQIVLQALKPGSYALVFGGTRTFHRLAVALEDAGFEMRDTLMWLYGSGFPKAKSCLKPAWEPILLCRRPGPKALPLDIEGCRIGVDDDAYAKNCSGDRGHADNRERDAGFKMGCGRASDVGRWPANVIHDGSAEVVELFPEQSGGGFPQRRFADKTRNTFGEFQGHECPPGIGATSGNASRFFYCAKASADERDKGLDGMPKQACGTMEDDGYSWEGEIARGRKPRDAQRANNHPTVKPLELMRWLVRLVTPKGGTCLDPFLGSGTTAVACEMEGLQSIGIEREPAYVEIARGRIGGLTRGTLFESA